MKTITVFGTSQSLEGSADYAEARRVGQLLGATGYTVVTGGYDGSMEAVSRGAREAGARVIGVTLRIFDPKPANRWVDEEIKMADFFARLQHMIQMGDGFLVLRGGIGTLTELALTWSLLQTKSIAPKPMIVVGESWRAVIESFRPHLIIREHDWRWLRLARDADEAVSQLRQSLESGMT